MNEKRLKLLNELDDIPIINVDDSLDNIVIDSKVVRYTEKIIVQLPDNFLPNYIAYFSNSIVLDYGHRFNDYLVLEVKSTNSINVSIIDSSYSCHKSTSIDNNTFEHLFNTITDVVCFLTLYEKTSDKAKLRSTFGFKSLA